MTFPGKTGESREFVEHLWARRKVGYMLDQIRANGEKKELVDEVVMLAKKYGISTPYASYRIVQGRNVMEIGGVWIDEGFDPKLSVVTVKAQSDAYFRILERHAEVKDVFLLGNYVIWVTPSGTVLAIDANNGKDKLSDEEIDKLFVAKK